MLYKNTRDILLFESIPCQGNRHIRVMCVYICKQTFLFIREVIACDFGYRLLYTIRDRCPWSQQLEKRRYFDFKHIHAHTRFQVVYS